MSVDKPTLSIDEILGSIANAYVPTDRAEFREVAKQQLTQLIADIIGENYEAKDPFNEGRNKLRAEQRQRAKERGIDL